MARSRPSNTFIVPAVALLAALAVLGLAQPAAAASLGTCKEKIEVVGDNLDGNLKKNFTELRNVTISGCDARIDARVARFSKLDFDDSRWTFEGDVRIRMESQQGSLSSDQAVVNFRNNQIERVTITGKPAQFQQKRSDSDAIARGRAGQIIYELGAGTVNLTDNAWICDGTKEVRSAKVVYDLVKQELKASSAPAGGQRVRLTIDPQANSKDANSKDGKDGKKAQGTPSESICGVPPAWSSGTGQKNAPAEKPPAP
jgi:lipopolysaccharide transport protein LptA